MVMYNSGDLKSGLKVLIDGEPFNIVETDFHKPGKGQAFNKVKLRNLRNGKVLEKKSLENSRKNSNNLVLY